MAHCPRCAHDEIYPRDEVGCVDGTLIHKECMTGEELEDYPTYPAISFFQEAC